MAEDYFRRRYEKDEGRSGSPVFAMNRRTVFQAALVSVATGALSVLGIPAEGQSETVVTASENGGSVKVSQPTWNGQPANIIDGDESTQWQVQGNPNTISVVFTLQQEARVTGDYLNISGTGGGRDVTGYEVQARDSSDDSWSTEWEFNGSVTDDGSGDISNEFDSPFTGREFRLVITSHSAPSLCFSSCDVPIAEYRLYGQFTEETQTTRSERDGEASAEIDSFSVAGSSFSPGDTIGATTTVTNTGENGHTFFVGYSATPDGSNTVYDNDGSTGSTITLAGGETGSVDLSVTIPEDAPTSGYTLLTSVWAESDRNSLETRLATADASVTLEGTTTTTSGSSTDFLSGTVVDINENPVSNVQVEAYFRAGSGADSEGSTIDPGAQFIGLATTDESGVFEFDGSGDGVAIPRSEVDQVRAQFSVGQNMGVSLVAQEMPPDSASMTTGRLWFGGVSLPPGDFFTQDFNREITLRYQQLFRRSVGGDGTQDANSQVRVYREIDTDDTTTQYLHIAIRGAGEVGIIGNGICAFKVPEDINVGYNDVDYGVWRGGVTDTYPFSLGELGTMGAFQVVPLFPVLDDYAFSEVTEQTGDVAEIWDEAFAGIIGLLPLGPLGTIEGFIGTMSDIYSEERRPAAVIGEMSEYDPNTEDLARGNWPEVDQHIIDFQIPVTLEGGTEYSFEARAVWDAHVRGILENTQTNTLGHEFTLSSDVAPPGR